MYCSLTSCTAGMLISGTPIRIIVVYNDRQLKLVRNDKSTWKEAIEHGKDQGIPENELGFPTD